MQYTKLFFLSASVLTISTGVFAVDVPLISSNAKNSYVFIQYGGRRAMKVFYNPQEPVRELIRDFKNQAGIPDTVSIELLMGANKLDENALSGSYSFKNVAAKTAVR